MQQFLPVRVKVRRHRVVNVAKAIIKSVPSLCTNILVRVFMTERRATCFSFLRRFSLYVFSFLSKRHGRGQRPKISQSEGESAGESGERRRWEHAECVFFFCLLSLSLFVERYPLNYVPNWKQNTSGAHYSFSLFFLYYYRNRGKRSGEIDPVQSVHASVRVDAESLGVEKTRGE